MAASGSFSRLVESVRVTREMSMCECFERAAQQGAEGVRVSIV